MPVTFRGTTLRNTTYLSQWSPQQLFTSNEQGVWFDPSDMTTMFQDSAGTTPVTAMEQPVGVILDKSKGLVLGPELVTNGTFDSNITGWTQTDVSRATASWSSGQLRLNYVDGYAGATAPVSLIAGKTYKISGILTCVGQPNLASRVQLFTIPTMTDYSIGAIATSNFVLPSTPTQVSVYYTPTSSGTFYVGAGFRGTPQSGDYILADNISVREIFGNHAFQTTAAARPLLSARVNTLVRTEEFDNAAWTKPNATVTANQAASPIGTSTADRLAEKNTTATPNAFQVASTNPAGTYAYSCAVKKDTQRYAIVSFAQIGGAYTAACIDLDNGTITKSGVSTGVTAPAVPTSVSLGDGWHRVTVYGTTTATLNSVAVQPSDTGNPTFGAFGDYSYAGNSSNAIYIWGADLRVTNDGVGLPSYQRVNTSTDYDTVGFPPYLRFDGVDDFLSTSNINFSNTDKMSIFTGVRKLNPAGVGMIAEFGTTFNTVGSFYLYDPPAGTDYEFSAYRDSQIKRTLYGYFTPITNVLTGIYDFGQSIASNEILTRVNGGVVDGTFTGSINTGNFGNHSLYIGRRGGSTLPFNGRLYSLIVCGALEGSGEINNTETWINNKTRAY